MHALQLERNVNYHLLVFTVGAGISVLVGLFGLMVMKRSGFFRQMAEIVRMRHPLPWYVRGLVLKCNWCCG